MKANKIGTRGKVWSKIVLLPFILLVLGCAAKRKGPELSEEPDVVVSIKGMTCNLCSTAIRTSLLQVKGIREVDVSWQDHAAYLLLDPAVSDQAIERAVQRAGDYRVLRITRKPRE